MTINYIITPAGIIVVKAGKEASALLRQMGLSMGDDLAKLFNQ